MNLRETIFSIFPGSTVTCATDDEGLIEVSGISGSVAPQNCEVLASGVFQYSSTEHSLRSYLVRVNELTLLVRMATDAQSRLCAQIVTRPSRKINKTLLH